MIFDSLKEKFEYYRNLTDYRLLPNAYVMVMLDGRSFSKLIKNRFEKPFDINFIKLMDETMKYLCEKVAGVCLGYTQSDEILLVIKDTSEKEPFFSYRLTKLVSICASLATAKFNRLWTEHVLQETGKFDTEIPLVQFDCKCWNVPNENDVIASFLYRQLDCIRNSEQQFCQTYLNHKLLRGKNVDEQVELVKELKKLDWNDTIKGAKYGRVCYKEIVEKQRESDELITFTLVVERNVWTVRDAPILSEKKCREMILGVISDNI